MQHFLTIAETSGDDLLRVLGRGLELREADTVDLGNPGRRSALPRLEAEGVLRGRAVVLYFEKPSLRTRVSMEGAVGELGGRSVVLDAGGVGLGVRESVGDVARVLAGMVDCFAGRVFDHGVLVEMAGVGDEVGAGMPIVNMLSDVEHPCQALADVMTLMDEWGREPGDLRGRRLAWIGDGNNVARSLAWAAAKLGMGFVQAAPPGYELDAATLDGIAAAGGDAAVLDDPYEAVRGADAVFTDTFVSMGQEAQKADRLKVFSKYQVNAGLMAAAPAHAVVLHCLPAYRGVEITDEVLDGPQSRVFPEAHNRLHAQKGLLAELLG